MYALNLTCGVWYEDEEILKREARLFFQALFCPPSASHVSPLASSVVTGLPLSASHVLFAPVTKEEVWMALSRMGSFKAPGPYGFQALLFKEY